MSSDLVCFPNLFKGWFLSVIADGIFCFVKVQDTMLES